MKKRICILQGFVAGILISLPKGPAGFLVINQTIAYGFNKGAIIASGCALTTFGTCAMILLPRFSWSKRFFNAFSKGLHTCSVGIGCLLIILGIYLFRLKIEHAGNLSFTGALMQAMGMCVVTIINPLILVQTILIFSLVQKLLAYIGIGTHNVLEQEEQYRLMTFLGIVAGVVTWYAFSLTGASLTQINIETINKFTAVLLILGGCALLFKKERPVSS
jgi:hypothetical protein